MITNLWIVACALSLAKASGSTAPAQAETGGAARPLRVVYFDPADRESLPGYRERLDRAMTEIQAWYAREMERNGFGPRSFPLERDAEGRLVVHVVKSERAYARDEEITTEEMRERTVKPALAQAGLDVDREHIVIFANSVFIEEREGVQYLYSSSAYCGGGDHRGGTAWVTDHPLLDPENLERKEPRILDGGERPYDLAHYNVTYLGGVAHELGHSFGLPHDHETPEQHERLGYSLMGEGNYHLFGKRAGDERESYLSLADATILSAHPLFRSDASDPDLEAWARMEDLALEPAEASYLVRGRLRAEPRAYAVVAYHDHIGEGSDYDATSWVASVDAEGRFELLVGALEPGPYELRLRACLANGDSWGIAFRFVLDESLRLPREELGRQVLYALHVQPALDAHDASALDQAIEGLRGVDDLYLQRALAYRRLWSEPEPAGTAPSALPVDLKALPLSSMAWKEAEVGWDRPARDRIPEAIPLESGARVHERGLYAHAPSRYLFELAGQWKRLTSAYGLQNENEGSVVFVIRCDGVERFRSEVVRDWQERAIGVDLEGVHLLELTVEDADDGRWADCGVWLSPELRR